jgi:hypothetical protein
VLPLRELGPQPVTACRAGRAGTRMREELRRGGSVRTHLGAARPRAEVARCGRTSAWMASQQAERAAELQAPEVRAELDRRVRECEWECSAGGRLGSFPQATREQAGDPGVREQSGSGAQELRPGVAVLRMAAQACGLCFSSTRA